MVQQLTVQITHAVAIDGLNPNTNETVAFSSSTPNGVVYAPAAGYEKKLLLKFSDLSAEAKASVLKSLEIIAMSSISVPSIFTVRIVSEDFDPSTVTWNTRPTTYSWSELEFAAEDWVIKSSRKYLEKEITCVSNNWDRIVNAIAYGLEISCSLTSSGLANGFMLTQNFLTLNYEAVSTTIGNAEPREGAYISKSRQNTFSWGTTDNGLAGNPPEAYKPTIQSGLFLWKESESATEEKLSATSATSITVPANTFTSDSVMWAAQVQLDNGEVLQSDWITLTTIEALSSAIAIAPANLVIDGSTEAVFTWEHVIETGTAPTGYDIQTSSGGDIWNTVASGNSDKTSAIIPAGTLEGGNLLWRVRTYNSDGSPGEWSAPLQIIVIAAPEAPILVVENNSPRFAIRWQQSGQQAYELMVDGAVIAKAHSAESIYRHNGYLEPGMHTVRVRIQNKYQMWSDWATVNLQIINEEGEGILLTAAGDNEVSLRWHTSEAYDSYIIYRNAVKIGETAAASFTDHFAVGEASYQVRGVYGDSGYYTLSNTATVTVTPKTLLIADIDNPVWIPLPLSTSALRSAGLSASQSVTYTHFIGGGLPDAEIGEAVSRTYNLECAWKATELEQVRRFEALLGKAVCIKTPSQRRIIGVVSQMSIRENRFYVAYTMPITEIRWEGL